MLTAVALCWEQNTVAEISTSAVTFRALARDEIERYIATGEPFDKAGAYAIQGRAATFVQRIDGSHSGIMGLPLYETGDGARRHRVPRAITTTLRCRMKSSST